MACGEPFPCMPDLCKHVKVLGKRSRTSITSKIYVYNKYVCLEYLNTGSGTIWSCWLRESFTNVAWGRDTVSTSPCPVRKVDSPWTSIGDCACPVLEFAAPSLCHPSAWRMPASAANNCRSVGCRYSCLHVFVLLRRSWRSGWETQCRSCISPSLRREPVTHTCAGSLCVLGGFLGYCCMTSRCTVRLHPITGVCPRLVCSSFSSGLPGANTFHQLVGRRRCLALTPSLPCLGPAGGHESGTACPGYGQGYGCFPPDCVCSRHDRLLFPSGIRRGHHFLPRPFHPALAAACGPTVTRVCLAYKITEVRVSRSSSTW